MRSRPLFFFPNPEEILQSDHGLSTIRPRKIDYGQAYQIESRGDRLVLKYRLESVAGGCSDRLSRIVLRQADVFNLREIAPVGARDRFDEKSYRNSRCHSLSADIDYGPLTVDEVDLQAFFSEFGSQLLYNVWRVQN